MKVSKIILKNLQDHLLNPNIDLCWEEIRVVRIGSPSNALDVYIRLHEQPPDQKFIQFSKTRGLSIVLTALRSYSISGINPFES